MKSSDIEVSSLFKALAIKIEQFEQGELIQSDEEAILLISACCAMFWEFKKDLGLATAPDFNFADKNQLKALHAAIYSTLSRVSDEAPSFSHSSREIGESFEPSPLDQREKFDQTSREFYRSWNS